MNIARHGPLSHIGELSVEEFLKVYWQKKPVLIRQAFKHLPYLSAEELAGYALEEEVESRLIIETPVVNEPLNSKWQCIHGPLYEKHFNGLPQHNWTLLVQAVNQLSEDMHHFLHQFRFIPNWRLDDVMVSYAVQGGNVGPHFDYYDVFLVQAQGSRQWQLGQHCNTHTPLKKDAPLKLLTTFEPNEVYDVEPGDVLYIPPGLAHWGTALNDSMTYSVGFRAPSRGEMLLDYSEQLASLDSADLRFADPLRSAAQNAGEIKASDIQIVKQNLSTLLENDEVLTSWLGKFLTQPSRSDLCFEPEQRGLRLAPHCIAAYIEKDPDHASLFINGEQFDTTLTFAKTLCGYHEIQIQHLTNAEKALVTTWCEDDWLLGDEH